MLKVEQREIATPKLTHYCTVFIPLYYLSQSNSINISPNFAEYSSNSPILINQCILLLFPIMHNSLRFLDSCLTAFLCNNYHPGHLGVLQYRRKPNEQSCCFLLPAPSILDPLKDVLPVVSAPSRLALLKFTCTIEVGSHNNSSNSSSAQT